MDRTDRTTPIDTTDLGAAAAEYATQAQEALRRLARLTINQPALNPAEIDVVLGHLAEGIAALPQVAPQLARILERSGETHHLSMDDMTATTDPQLAIDTARGHLDNLCGPALETYRHLNAARNETAHIRVTPVGDAIAAEEWPSTMPPVHPIHIREEWHDHALLTFEQFCDLIQIPVRTVRNWRRRQIGPRCARLEGCGRLCVTVAEVRRFLLASTDDRRPSPGNTTQTQEPAS